MRVTFEGVGTRVPDEAMPGPGSSDLPPITLNLPDGGTFDKQSYIEIGYTNYEVWCIGAAGGRGGGRHQEEGSWSTGQISSYGGGGGGGGLVYVQGELDGLPEGDIVAVVGQAGADGADGTHGSTAEKYMYETTEGGIIVVDNPDYIPVLDGEDGGYSAFISDIDEYPKASGGKGGKATPIFYGPRSELVSDPSRMPGGDGGEGGIGGQVEAGGGAAGGSHTLEWAGVDPIFDPHIIGSDAINAEDGTWDGEIGRGGGGGSGGSFIPHQTTQRVVLIHMASNGGVGNFSYGDSSFYGAKGTRTNDFTNYQILPGFGGGAKIGLLTYGARVPGYSPNGAVVIRLTKIV